MKLNPQQAPLYGECVLTVQLDNEEVRRAEEVEEEEGVEFYLLFLGSNQRHLTTTFRVSRVTLQATCPAHDVCEPVLVTLCSARPSGQVDPCSQESFCYVQDLALDMANFLLNNTAPQGALLLDDDQVPLQECERLDQTLALALKHLTLRRRRTALGIHTEPQMDRHAHKLIHKERLCDQQTQMDMHQKAHADANKCRQTDKLVGNQTGVHTNKQTDLNMQTCMDAHVRRNSDMQLETYLGTRMDDSTELENGVDFSKRQPKSTLLHFAASRGLRRVAQFLLQQPGGREALRQPDAQGETPVCLADRRGDQQLSELFTRFEKSSSDLRVESGDELLIYPGGRIFQHHPSLGTYTLTISSYQDSEGEGEHEERQRSKRCRLQEEVTELRGLVQLHRDKKKNTNLCDITPASPHLFSNHGLCISVGGMWPCSNHKPEIKGAVGLTAATSENCDKPVDRLGGPTSLEERRVEEDSTIVSATSCTHQLIQEEGKTGEQEDIPVADWCTVRCRKNKKRTTKTTIHASKTTGFDRTSAETVDGSKRNSTKTTGSRPGSSIQAVTVFEEESTENKSSHEGASLPIKPLSSLGGEEGNQFSTRGVALVTTTVEKQEGEDSKLGLKSSDGDTEKEKLTKDTGFNYTARERDKETNADFTCESATEVKVAMGQGQSLDPQDSHSDTEEPASDQSPHLSHRGSHKSMGLEGIPRRLLWRDGGWMGSGIGSAPHGSEMVSNTVWYQDENTDWTPKQEAEMELQRKEPVPLAVWYDSDMMDPTLAENVGPQLEQEERKHKEHDVSRLQDSGPSSQQPLEHRRYSQPLSSALSQVHGAGTEPTLSHGPAAQRQEVHGAQQEEGGREEGCGEKRKLPGPGGGVMGGGEVADSRERTAISEEIGEGEEAEEKGGEKGGSEEKGERGKKKRRKKRGKRGGTEVKFSSSSSTESQTQTEMQKDTPSGMESQTNNQVATETEKQSDTMTERPRETARETVIQTLSHMRRERQTDLILQSELERQIDTPTQPEAKPKTGRADFQSPSTSESVLRKEADTGTMHLPSQTEGESSSSHKPNCELSSSDSSSTTPEIGQMEKETTEKNDFMAVAESESKDLSNSMETEESKVVEMRMQLDNIDSTGSPESTDFSVKTVVPMELTRPVESNFAKEIPFEYSNSTNPAEDFHLVNLPRHDTELVQSVKKADSIQPVELQECLDSVEIPEDNTKSEEYMGPTGPVQPHKHLRTVGKSVSFIESVQPEEAVECSEFVEPGRRLFKRASDMPQLQKQEGSTETTRGGYLEHCLATELLRDRQSVEKKMGTTKKEEEMGEEKREAEKNQKTVWGEGQSRQSEMPVAPDTEGGKRMAEGQERKGEEGSKTKLGAMLSSTCIEEEVRTEARCRQEDEGSDDLATTDLQEKQHYIEELAAAAVAIVTVAIASAVANMELTRLLEGSQSEITPSTQTSQEFSRGQVELLDNKVPSETEICLQKDLHAEQSTQPTSKDHTNIDFLVDTNTVKLTDQDKEQTTHKDTTLSLETENCYVEHSDIEPSTQSNGEKDTVELTTVALTEIEMFKSDDKLPEKQLWTQMHYKPTMRSDSKEHDNSELSTPSDVELQMKVDREDVKPGTYTENLFVTKPNREPLKINSPAQSNSEPFTAFERVSTSQRDSLNGDHTKSQLYQDSKLPAPITITGKCGKVSDVFDSHGEAYPRLGDPSNCRTSFKDDSASKREGDIPVERFMDKLECNLKEYETDSAGAKTFTAGKLDGQTLEQEHVDTVDSGCKTEGRESGEEGITDMPHSHLKVKECKGDLDPGSQHEGAHVVAQGDEVIRSLLPSCEKTLPVALCDSLPPASLLQTGNSMVHSNPDSKDLTTSVCPDNGTSHPLPQIGFAATPSEIDHSTLQCEGAHSSLVVNENGMFQDREKNLNALDTVDGWKERERDKVEGRWETITAQEPHTEVETCSTANEQPQRRETDLDTKLNLEIQREKETFCPLQPCPEYRPPALTSTAVTTCTDLRPVIEANKEDCVSVCVLERDTAGSEAESLTLGAELDDSVFKKPEAPVPGCERRERGVCVSWSSTDDTSSLGRLSTSSLPSCGAWSATASDTAAPWSSADPWKSETEEGGGEGEEVGMGGGEEEERKDQLTENPVSSAILRASIRSLSPFRRHSWEPGKNNTAGETDMAHRSSLKNLSGEIRRTKPPLHRRSMSWCPSNLPRPDQEQIDNRSYSLEGLEVERGVCPASCANLGMSDREGRSLGRGVRLDNQEKGGGSLVSLTEEEQEGDASSIDSQGSHRALSMTTSCHAMSHHQILTKSISMLAISHRETDGVGSSSSTSGSLEYSISEEEPGPLRSDTEMRGGGTKVSRTFSYLRSKMSKKSKEKDKDRKGEKEREIREKEKKLVNGHLFSPVPPCPSSACQQCTKALNTKEAFLCNNCGAHVHKSCRESLPVCAKSKMKQQSLAPEAGPGSAVNLRNKSTSSTSSLPSSSSTRERWSALTSPEDQVGLVFPRRNPSILSFNTHSNLSKSISTSNIAGLDEVPLKGLKFLSQSTDSLHQGSKVNASTESLTDEGTEMMDSQLMGEFECEVKNVEADSWSATVDKKFLKLHKKDEVKRQDVIYELYQTEFHHLRTLRIMSEVYYKGVQKELQLDTHTLDKIFPMLEDLLDTHTHFLTLLLERKRASLADGRNNNSFLIRSIGDVLVNQFSGCNAERLKKVYGKFCSRHNDAVNLYKELLAKDKRFQAFIKRMMSSSIVRRLSIPECILLVTQRITKYPVLIQRILQHTKDTDEDHGYVSEALRCVKELIAAVDSKVNEQEKKRRLREVYSRTDSKSIMRMKSGQMFAKEDLIRGRRLLHDGVLQLKNTAGRLKDVHAMLLSDVLVFLQEKDQKYVFASLDQRSTVISLQKLIVREVANEERGLFLITAGIERPEMVEVLASSKEERNTWMAIIQDAMQCMEKDEDEGVPSETEEDRRQQENRAKEIREQLRRKDEQIVSLLKEKIHIFRDLCDSNSAPDDTNPPLGERMLFRATPDDVTKGEPIMKDALKEVETLHALVNTGLGGAGCITPVSATGGGVGPVCLPRRAETFGGFDSHQMNSSKNGEKEEGDDSLDLRRTESDSVLKKGANTSLQMLLKRNNEVQHSVTRLHDLLTSLQAVVVQQDSFIEDQRQALNDRTTTNSSSRHSSSSSLSSTSSSRPSSLIEQEKQRSLERQRQEAASLQKQQAAHQEEKRRREKEWEVKEKRLAERHDRLREEEEEANRKRKELEEERDEFQKKKEDYQRDLERLRESQRRLERDKEALRRETERMEAVGRDESDHLHRYQRTPSTTSDDSLRFHSSSSLDLEPREAPEQAQEVELSSSAPTKEPFLRIGSKRMSKNFNPFSSSSKQGSEKESQLPTRLLQLAKPKEKKEKKKKKGKGGESQATVTSEAQNDGDIYFC
ncbi:A-kinase anchor protein 13-like [Lampris incognitus]|uniref:A-kinase anchor protein 13-like n=1 Tax=Lampris incognitus TaxID=2546036 RepID=UPI0024B514CC|nr:A-kinase anchor protein 13-like [Lampris incognitus]